jgi:hypothetical protein
MARYLDIRFQGRRLPPPDLPTRIRTNPRVTAVLWSLATASVGLVFVALVVSHVF